MNCPGCNVPAAFVGNMEIDESYWRVNKGDTVERWTCHSCRNDWVAPLNFDELSPEEQHQALWLSPICLPYRPGSDLITSDFD